MNEIIISRQQIDLDLHLALFNFHDQFEKDPQEGIRRLLELLVNENECLARIGYLQSLAEHSQRRFTPGGELPEPRFLRELVWIANGELDEVVTRFPDQLRDLPHLLSDAVGLGLARKCLLEGMPAIQDRVDARQQEVQDWLWEQLKSESLLKWDEGRFVGHYVASWSRFIPFQDLPVAKDPAKAIHQAYEKWGVSPALVATVFVESIWS